MDLLLQSAETWGSDRSDSCFGETSLSSRTDDPSRSDDAEHSNDTCIVEQSCCLVVEVGVSREEKLSLSRRLNG